MPFTFTVTVDDENLAKIVSAFTGGSAPALTSKTDPPAVSDGKKKGGKADAKAAEAAKEQEAAAAAEPPADPNAEVPTTDLVTEKQNAAAQATADAAELDDARAQLTDYYTGQGSTKKEVQTALAGMSEEELRSAYLDYLARLVMDADGEFTADFDTPYIATRINDGVESKKWVKGGVTMSDEDVAKAKLADPNPAPAAAAPKKPGLPLRKK